MKARHVFAIMVGAALLLWTLASCNMDNSVTISQRISDFQADLNTSTRTNVYQDFHPSLTTEYNVLKDPNASGFNAFFPTTGPSYSLTIFDLSDPATGVIVVVNQGPTNGAGHATPYYLKLTMAAYNNNDERIVALYESATNGNYGAPLWH